jgi:pSer/pThr/pTyr-binding forkhead associated (FHA) protein
VQKGGQTIEQVSVGARSCYVLGRSEDQSDVWLQHPSISRQHAAVAHNEQGQVCLVDLGSAQGTFVNGQEIEPNKPRPLKAGDRIQFGASTRTYVFQNAVEAEEETQKERKKTGVKLARGASASADPELQRMMREMQSFGEKPHREVKEMSAEKETAEREKVRTVSVCSHGGSDELTGVSCCPAACRDKLRSPL